MSVGKEENVFIDAIHMEIRIVFHSIEIEGCKEVGAAQGSAGMAALNGVHHTYNIPSDLCGSSF